MDFLGIKELAIEMGLSIVQEVPEEELIVVRDENRGISGMIIDCEGDILIIEQPIGKFPPNTYRWFLEKNRELPFGAFAYDPETDLILFRNTLRLDTLDREEFESTLSALEIFFAEHGQKLLELTEKIK